MHWPLLLTIAGLGCAFAPVATGLPDLPVPVPYLFMVAGASWGWRVWQARCKEPRNWLRGTLAVAQVVAPLLLAAWYFGLARYEAPSDAPAPGDVPPDFVLERVSDGAPFQLLAQRGDVSVLLIFFRGPW